jgi:hypothetical protein
VSALLPTPAEQEEADQVLTRAGDVASPYAHALADEIAQALARKRVESTGAYYAASHTMAEYERLALVNRADDLEEFAADLAGDMMWEVQGEVVEHAERLGHLTGHLLRQVLHEYAERWCRRLPAIVADRRRGERANADLWGLAEPGRGRTPTAVDVWEAIQRAKREIADDIRDGRVHDDVHSFPELHSFVDANEYGGICEFLPIDWCGVDQWVSLANEVQYAVDDWMRAGSES